MEENDELIFACFLLSDLNSFKSVETTLITAAS